jgi:hypothetical protein
MKLLKVYRFTISAALAALLILTCSCSGAGAPPDPESVPDEEVGINQPGENEGDDSKNVLLLLTTMKNWVVTHSPHHKYDPATDEYGVDDGTGLVLRKSGSTCHSLRFLSRYYAEVAQDQDVYEKIISLSDFILSLQYADDPNEGHYGAFIKNEGDVDNYYYSTNASHCAEALLYSYQVTNVEKYREASINGANFLIRMQDPALGAIYEYYHAGVSHPIKNQVYTKLFMALPLFKAMYQETGEEKYANAGERLRNSILTFGLEVGYEYFEVDRSADGRPGDDSWHRDTTKINDVHVERYMYGDSASFAIRAIYEYEGYSQWLGSIYEFYNSFTGGENAVGYNPDICWAGYLSPETKTIDRTGRGYYDMISVGILLPYRKGHDTEAYEISRQMMFDNPEASMIWGLRFSYEVEDISPWQNNITISNIAEGLVQSNPYE